ncbi:MAG: hypothetical protein ACK4J0_00180 [Candidatus Anstonellaceae archaeon]
MEEEKSERGEINSEIRYLTLELTKLAKKTKIPFRKIAQEYVKNVFMLEEIVIKNVKEYYRKKENQTIKKGKRSRY